MREILVTDLVEGLLGPRNGLNEEVEGSPLKEYVVGVLSPVQSEKTEDELGVRDSKLVGDSRTYEGDDDDSDIAANTLLSPALDPQKRPSSMGLSFDAKFADSPGIDICATWARYIKNDGTSKWMRHLRHAIIRGDGNNTVWLGSDGNVTDEAAAEVSIHTTMRRSGDRSLISVYLVNRIKIGGDRPIPDEHIFQPQLRIVCHDGTEIVPKPEIPEEGNYEEKEFETAYSDKESLGRGHMTSVIWKKIDPEILHDVDEIDYPDCMHKPGFSWRDGADENISPEDRKKFSEPDIRTEFIPMYSVPAPDVETWGGNPAPHNLDPAHYAELYDPDELRDALEPFDSAYGKWVEDLRQKKVRHEDVKSDLVKKAEEIHERIKKGIEFLCQNEDARLSFCFASRAIYQQAQWEKHKEPFKLRPFQLGFVLLSVESTLCRESADRKKCDLLWVPTGTGKTEAYLFLVAMTAAYRRLRALKNERSGDGVAVISRYTLRLLAIQQFRRTLSLITAMEFLRVDGLENGGRVGWRPLKFEGGGDFLWGTTRFSVGLWAGTKVTPNKLGEGWNTKENKSIPGALAILKNSQDNKYDPAQILNCPACKTILSVPHEYGPKGDVTLHHMIQISSNTKNVTDVLSEEKINISIPNITLNSIKVKVNRNDVFTLSVEIKSTEPFNSNRVKDLCNQIKIGAKNQQVNFEYLAPESRPGYFFKYSGKKEPDDFEIYCPNPNCPLKVRWAAGSPYGNCNGRGPCPEQLTDSIGGISSPDHNMFVDANPIFELDANISDRIPIPAFSVDEQIYAQIPTMVVATVDKFARLPFQEKSAHLFGNVDRYHCVDGYSRHYDEEQTSKRRKSNPYIDISYKPSPPNLIIQDELHLLDGALGSMVGIYEAAIDHLSSHQSGQIKYVASTATIRRAEDHVKALFARELTIFPPKGLPAGNRFFVNERDIVSPLNDRVPGRLYVGICAPGMGPLTPIVRIWSGLAHALRRNSDNSYINHYWAITGYFNAVRELAGAIALYRQDIQEWLDHLSGGKDSKRLEEEKLLELSGRTHSTDLPSYLDMLDDVDKVHGPDALFTTSMFGTGVDVSKINTMIVNGQPKTTSSYIQATGRVGRKVGAVVITFYRSTKPRDLNHYEFFCGHHLQLHRYVEPPAVFPFAQGIMEQAIGPILVAMLRNGKKSKKWAPNSEAMYMRTQDDSEIVKDAKKFILERSLKQPKEKVPDKLSRNTIIENRVHLWQKAAEAYNEEPDKLHYVEYNTVNKPVVLGDADHNAADKDPVYEKVQQSMRTVEEEAEFES